MTTDPAEAIATLLAKDHISTAINNYALGMDLRDLSRFLSAWDPAAVWDINSAVGGGPLYAEGLQQITDAVQSLWAMEQLVLHLTANHEISVTNSSTATGDGHASILGATANGSFFMNGCVYPDDRYGVGDTGEWRILYRRVEINSYIEIPPEAASLVLFPGHGGAFGPLS